MIRDLNKGMTVIYNILNLPKQINISNELVPRGSMDYKYSADGLKKQVFYIWTEPTVVQPGIGGNGHVTGIYPGTGTIPGSGTGTAPNTDFVLKTKTVDYAGNKIYVDGKLDIILLGNGYIKDNRYHFYIRDHLGNNRVVIKELTNDDLISPSDPPVPGVFDPKGGISDYSVLFSKVVQRTDYYPSGLPLPGGFNPDVQKFKYNGKEFETMHGLNQYDYGARFYDAAVMRFHVPDPRVEKYIWISPYAYAANNPIRFIDWMGLEPGDPGIIDFFKRYWNAIGNPLDPMNTWGYGHRDGMLQDGHNITKQDWAVATAVIGGLISGGSIIEASAVSSIVSSSISIINNADNALSNSKGDSFTQQLTDNSTNKLIIEGVKAFISAITGAKSAIDIQNAVKSFYTILGAIMDETSVINTVNSILQQIIDNINNNDNNNDEPIPFDDDDLNFFRQGFGMGGGSNRNRGNLQPKL
jgi:RHS repeat-associated protein